MGRFYKTAKPDMIDFMHKLPEKALFAAVDQADKQYEDVVKYVTDLEKYNKVNAQESDVERKDELLKEVDAKIKDFTYQLHSSPSSARKSMGEIKQFGQKLYENYTRGEMAGIQSAYDAEEAWVKQETERMTKEKGRVLTSDIEEFRRVFNEQYNKPIYEKVVDPETGTEKNGKLTGYGGGLNWDATKGKGQNSFITENIANYIDAEDVATKAVAHWKEDSEKTHNTEVQGNYIISTIDGSIVANANDIYNTSYNALKNNEELMARYNQRIKHGLMSKEDLYGKIDPDTGEHVGYPKKNEKTGKVEIDPRTGKPEVYRDEFGNVIPVKGGILYETAMGTAEEFGFNRTEKGITGLQETHESKARTDEAIRREGAEYDKARTTPTVDISDPSAVSVYEFTDADGNPIPASMEALENKARGQQNALDSEGRDVEKSLIESIPYTNPKARLDFSAAWAEGMASGDFSKASKIASENNIGVAGPNGVMGNGVDEFAKKYNEGMINIDNSTRLLSNIKTDAAYELAEEQLKGRKFGPGEYDKVKQELADKIIKEAAEMKQNMGGYMASFHPLNKKIDNRVRESYQDVKKVKVVRGGNSLGNEVSQDDKNWLNNTLTTISKTHNLFDLMSNTGSARKFEGTDSKGKSVTYEDLLSNNNITAANLVNLTEDGTYEVMGKDGKRMSVKIESKVGVIPEDVGQIGSGARHLTVQMQTKEAGTDGAYKLSTFKILIPKKEMRFDQRTESILNVAEAAAKASDFQAKGDAMYRHEKSTFKYTSPTFQHIQSPIAKNCYYYPNETQGALRGKWQIGDKTIYGDKGREAYGAYLISSGIIDSGYTPTTDNNKTSESSYQKVKTTTK